MQTAEASCPLSIQNNYTCYTVIVCYSLLKMTRISEASSPLSIQNNYTCYTVIDCCMCTLSRFFILNYTCVIYSVFKYIFHLIIVKQPCSFKFTYCSNKCNMQRSLCCIQTIKKSTSHNCSNNNNNNNKIMLYLISYGVEVCVKVPSSIPPFHHLEKQVFFILSFINKVNIL